MHVQLHILFKHIYWLPFWFIAQKASYWWLLVAVGSHITAATTNGGPEDVFKRNCWEFVAALLKYHLQILTRFCLITDSHCPLLIANEAPLSTIHRLDSMNPTLARAFDYTTGVTAPACLEIIR